MSRRLLGYVVRQLDGTRSPLTPTPIQLVYALDAWDQTPVDAGDYVVPVFAVRRPMPALVAPVVAEGGRYACLTEDSGDALFHDINDGRGGFPRDAQRSIGSREMALAFVGRWSGTKLVRVLDDGEHEAACEAAVRAERERVAALLVAEADRFDIGCEEVGAYLRAAEIANKGQAK